MPFTLRVFRTTKLDGLSRLKSFVRRKDLLTVGTHLATRIKQRTRGGKSVSGRAFTRYSPGYARQKGVSRSAVNLTSRGGGRHMVAALRVLKTEPNRAFLGMTDATLAERARIHDQGRGPQPERRWLGISRKDRAWLSRELKKAIRSTIRAGHRGSERVR